MESQASSTAQAMAMFRALESARAERARLFWDPLATCFLGPRVRMAVRIAAKSSALHALLTKFIDVRWPGARPSGVARTVFIDEAMREALRSGIEQVVILGAGYDARAYRMAEMRMTTVFEVDRAETQQRKCEALARVLGRLPENVRFVEMDFSRGTLRETLALAGFSRERKTFFIWEGVTHYLDADAVDSTMRFVGGCASDSRLAFTYVHRGLLDGSAAFVVGSNVRRFLHEAGEPWWFGLYPDALAGYLGARGLRLIEDLGAIEYGARCMGAPNKQMKGYEFYRVALAAVGLAGGGSCQK